MSVYMLQPLLTHALLDERVQRRHGNDDQMSRKSLINKTNTYRYCINKS